MKVGLIAFLDVLFCMLMVVIQQINPVQQQAESVKPPGTLFVYTAWPDTGSKNDVDTWMLAPGMKEPVGYDNKEGAECNLVKDDLGWPNDVNFENVFCRNIPDGEYAVNIHAYQTTTNPIQVKVQVMMLVNGKTEYLFDELVTLSHNKDEQTVIRFVMKDGKVVPESVNHVFISLYKPKNNGGF